ncbi:MAG: class I SAM-dependent methyltransferase [Chromatiales bacterium]|jgi:ubiquinone/menaquinone biosynthesis C-methylase UbiE
MQLMQSGELPLNSDMQLISQHLPLDNARLLELGCGAAFTTRQIAENFPVASIIAAEVDVIQHEKNLQVDDLPKVEFKLAGMQEIPEAGNSIDAAIMLKSLHHVPVDVMQQGFAELQRVLKPGGLLYISEPVFMGEFNEILRLFNDEEKVRQAAFAAIEQAITAGQFELHEEVHFNSQSRFQGFAEFEQRILGATHSNFDVDDDLFELIKQRFEPHIGTDGMAVFHNPMRVDILRKR